MNNISDKVKQYFSSNFGKLAGIIVVLSFIITLILSASYKNRIDISLLKALMSCIITGAILFMLGAVIKKYLGDVIDDSSSYSNMDIDYSAIDDNASEKSFNDADSDKKNTDSFDPDSISISVNSIKNDDKKNKSDYHSSRDDIGDIVFGNGSSSNASDYSTGSMFSDKKITGDQMMREVQEDPEKVAKAVRTMMAKDEKDSK
ncbi:hypothetical protein [uncultured Brachyspira sp.]|uniref:hypothetical protein n=1 Tax=uncultured Brachyspira sp. TaxID=221953 RepID=UPI0025FDDA60|nr:hypothetical protein [uncultured Brachyspira sp.]